MNTSIKLVDGKKIAFLGNISHKKGYQLLILAFQAIYEYDPEFTFHLGGRVDESRAAVFMDYSIKELGLQNNIVYHGYIDNVLEWLTQFDWAICTSPLEGSPVGLLQSLSVGLHPIFYNFVGAKDLYPKEYLWNTFPELIEIIKKGPRDPNIFKKFTRNYYSLTKQLSAISAIVAKMAEESAKPKEISPRSTVSAVLAVKNGSKVIKRAIESLLNQTYPLAKIIVVNDGSTDDTEDIVRGLFDTSKVPIEIITNLQSKWVFSARNQGFKEVDTDYFFFLDADDWVDKNYVEKMSTILDQNETQAVIYSDMTYFDKDGNEKVFEVPDFDPQILVQRNFIAYASMQRTSAFKDACGYSDYLNDCRNHLSEWDLWLRYVKAGFGFKRLAEPLFHYFNSGDEQMSHNYERNRQDQHLQLAIGITDGGKDIEMTGTAKRILLVVQGKDYCDRSQVGFELMTILKPLEMDGQTEVYTFQYDVEMQYYGRDGMLERLQTFADLVKPTYIFHFSYKDVIPVDMWRKLSEIWNTIVFHSDEWKYLKFDKDYEKGFRYAVTTYSSVFEQMEHPGKILSQWAANTHYFYPREKDIEVSFTGQANQNRKELINGLDVECYGLGFDNGFVSYAEMATVLGRSKISLSFSMGVNGRQLKLRPFEITASKALCICETMPGIEEFFVPGEEIILFDNRKELDEAVAYFTAHPDEAEAIAQAGYERTMKDHKWEHRLEKIFSVVDGK